MTPGEIQVAKAHVNDFGCDPELIDGVFTAETQAAVGAFQTRDGLPVSGLLQEDNSYYSRLEELYSPANSLLE